MQDNKLFVTGGTGFVGSHILNQLRKDAYSCIALQRNNAIPKVGTEWIKGDLLDPASYEAQLENVNTIIHAAGAVSYQKRDKDKLFRSNYIATKELVNIALYKQVKNIIYISSASTLIRSVDPLQISINALGDPIFNSYYAKTKFLAELEIWRAAAEGMNVCILYPTLVIGHWNWNQSSMRIFNSVKSGISYYPPGNLGIVTVDDLARIVSGICNQPINGQQILVNAEVWTYKDFLNEIAGCLNQKLIIKKASYWIAKTMSILDAFQALWNQKCPLITSETIKTSFAKFNYQSSIIQQDIGFHYEDIRKKIQEIVLQHTRAI